MLEMGLVVASADGKVGDDEVDHITRFLESRFLLDPPDARRLGALKQVLMKRIPSPTGMGKRLQAVLTAEECESIGRFLVGIAASNGTIDGKEITVLRGAYKALGIEAEVLARLLDEFQRGASEPVEVQRPTAPARPGEAIPPRPNGDGAIQLNEHLLRKILGDTDKVARMLEQAMRETEPEPETSEPTDEDAAVAPSPAIIPPRTPSPPPSDRRFEGLESRFHAVLAELLVHPRWSSADFDALVRRHQLMPSGLMDRINEWAEEHLGDLIIEEDGDDLTIHVNLVRDAS